MVALVGNGLAVDLGAASGNQPFCFPTARRKPDTD
jgi:hypothetical protein